MNLKKYIASIPGFPQEGIIFRDVTPILETPEAMHYVVDTFAEFTKEVKADLILGPEARGFLFGAPVALKANLPFAPVRKPGKLPRETVEETYELEYGADKLCIHADVIKPGQKIVVIDDLLATGGTAEAIVRMVKKLGGEVVGLGFIIELDDLKGVDKFGDIPVCVLTHFEGE